MIGNFLLLVIIGIFNASLAYADGKLDLQWAVCEDNIPRLLKVLDFKDESKSKWATYYDDTDFSYTKNSLQLKLEDKTSKKNAQEKIKSVVKVRLTNPNNENESDANCEIDRYGHKKSRHCSVEARASYDDIWTKKQKRFFERYAGSVNWKDLIAYGPYTEQQWATEQQGFEIQLEVLYGPGQAPIAEISLKTTESKEDEAYDLVSQWLSENKVKLCRVQQGKAKRLALLLDSASI